MRCSDLNTFQEIINSISCHSFIFFFIFFSIENFISFASLMNLVWSMSVQCFHMHSHKKIMKPLAFAKPQNFCCCGYGVVGPFTDKRHWRRWPAPFRITWPSDYSLLMCPFAGLAVRWGLFNMMEMFKLMRYSNSGW